MLEAGSCDLSRGSYPTPLVDSNGNTRSCFWKVVKGGVVGSEEYGVGDTLVYSVELSDYYKIDNTESVTSVDGLKGIVNLENKYVKKAGDTMTGALVTPIVKINQSGADTGLINNTGSNMVRSGGSGQATIIGNYNETTYIDSNTTILCRNSTGTEGRIYTSLNKPTAAELGVVSKAGDTMIGGLKNDQQNWQLGNNYLSVGESASNDFSAVNVYRSSGRSILCVQPNGAGARIVYNDGANANKEHSINMNRQPYEVLYGCLNDTDAAAFRMDSMDAINVLKALGYTPTGGAYDLNDLIKSGDYTLAGNWLNSHLGAGSNGLTGQLSVYRRLFDAGPKVIQKLMFSGVEYTRSGTGADGSETWSGWAKTYTSVQKPTAADINAGTFNGSFTFATGSGVGTRFGSTTHKALVGVSSNAGEYLFGGSKDGSTTFTDYVRIGRHKLQYQTDGVVRDIHHSGSGAIVKTTVLNAPSGVVAGKYYPIVFEGNTDQLAQEIYIDTRSSGASDPMNNCSFSGHVRNSGWSDGGTFVDGNFTIYNSGGRAIHSVWGGSENNPAFAFYVEARAFPVTIQHYSNVRVKTSATNITASECVFNAGVSSPAGTKIRELSNFNKGSGRYRGNELYLTASTLGNQLHPVGSVVLRMDAVNPSTIYGGTWRLITGDASLTFGNGSAQSGAVTGNNTPAVPVPAHTHSASQAEHNHNRGNMEISGNFSHTLMGTYGYGFGLSDAGGAFYADPASANENWAINTGFATSVGRHAANGYVSQFRASRNWSGFTSNAAPAVTVASTGTANATLNVRGARIAINVWQRVS
ncbi:hypothetical protein AB6Q85_002333 [Vibrio cholerae]